MKIVVTGGAGFIGSWVCDYYLNIGHEVLIIDNLTTGVRNNISEGAKFVEADIRDFQTVNSVIAEFGADIINHHAAQIDVRKSVDDPAFDAEVNIIGSINLLESAIRNGVQKFMFASTGGAIYGEPRDIPADENTAAVPISAYGTSKYAVEKYLSYYKELHGMDYVALRYANVYGPRQNPHGEAGVIAIFCNRIISGETCKVFGDGEQTRDYVFVEDVARANVLGLDAPCGSYNIGTGIEKSVNDLLSELGAASGGSFDVQYGDARAGEVQSISLDAKLAGKVLKWTPDVKLKEGIQRTWDWFNKERKVKY